jgi:pilus assembly protein TadC
MKKGFFYNLGKSILPEKVRVKIRSYLSKTGVYEVPFSLYGKSFIISMILTIVAYIFFVFPKIKTSNPIFLSISSFVMLTIVEFIFVAILFFSFWTYYEFVIFKRTQRIEEVLPDFLEEVATNLRAGMSFDKALWNSVEPEFDVLEKEIEIVAKKVMSGEDTEKALKEFADKYNSTLLQESMDMIIIGLRSGGNISDLIDRIVENVKQASFLRKELVASVTSYVIFIAAVSVVISPILFALSFNLMQIIQGLGEKLTSGSSYGALPFKVGAKSINPEDFINFSKIAVIIISSVSSIIIADLREGSTKAGIKYLFIFIPVSFIIYVVSLQLFTSIFGLLI